MIAAAQPSLLLCLEADRHTGRAGIELLGLTRILLKDEASIGAHFGELHSQGICERHNHQVEIKQQSSKEFRRCWLVMLVMRQLRR